MSSLPDNYVQFELKRTIWQVPSHFSDLQIVGAGAFGQVCSAMDARSKRRVAIKRLHHPFDRALQAKQALRELKLMKHLQHDNVISLMDTFTPQVK